MGRPRPPDLLILSAFALLCVWLGLLRARLAVDVENVAMLSDSSPEAAVDARRDALFGRDSTVLFLLEREGGALEGGAKDPRAAAWLGALAAVPGVRAARLLPVSAPGGGVFAAVELAPESSSPATFAPALARARAAAHEAAPAGFRVSATGQVAGQVAISDALWREERRVMPVLAVVLVLVLFAIYRSPALVAGAFLPAGGAVLCLGGVQRLLDVPLDPIATLLPPTLLTVGVAGAVHVLEAYLAERESGVAARDAPGAAVRHLLLPSVLSVLATIAGFLGLIPNALPAARSFGWLASLGTMLSAAMSLAVLPAWLRLTQPRPHLHRGRTWSRIATPLAGFLLRRSGAVIGLWALAGGLSLVGWSYLAVDSDPLRVLPPDHPFRADTDRIAAQLGGIETFDLLLSAPHPPAAPLALAGLAGALGSLPGVAGPAGAPRSAPDGTWLVRGLLEPGGAKLRNAAFDAALAKARASGWKNADVAGLSVRVARDAERLVRGQLRGLGLSVALIGALLMVGLRSLRLGFLGMIPNLLPCCLIYGGLAALGRPLTVPTAMIGTVFLGLVVDDTVHFLYSFRRARTGGESAVDAVSRSFLRTGRPVTITSLALLLGFAACLSGRLSTTREFGALAAAIVAAEVTACLTLLPALLYRDPRQRSPA